jgi:hypothetical protein
VGSSEEMCCELVSAGASSCSSTRKEHSYYLVLESRNSPSFESTAPFVELFPKLFLDLFSAKLLTLLSSYTYPTPQVASPAKGEPSLA